MRVLVVVADNIFQNSSANLCHVAYISGLSELGHKVDVIYSVNSSDVVDSSICLPDEVNTTEIDISQTVYKRLARRKNCTNTQTTVSSQNKKLNSLTATNSRAGDIKARLKREIRKFLFGAYGNQALFSNMAKKKKIEEEYDLVISLSYPAASHLAVYNLLRKKKLNAKQWLQIWEDPWFDDIYGTNDADVLKAEKKLVECKWVDRVMYVSPITLCGQKKLFPKAAEKMFWQPLPQYYSDSQSESGTNRMVFGYFGDYLPNTRNLRPFYEAAKKAEVVVNICGNPSDLFEPTDKVNIYPRMTLAELRKIENATDILVFLCNLRHGQIPGKIYQYSATYRKILFILDGTDEEKKVLYDYFSKFNRYYFTENTEESILAAISRIQDGNDGIRNTPIQMFKPTNIIHNIIAELG